jgi:hypothetical protein
MSKSSTRPKRVFGAALVWARLLGYKQANRPDWQRIGSDKW